MKKSVCLMAILGALGATSAFAAQKVIVEFTGEVRDTACEISLIDGSKTLDLGHILSSAKKDSPEAKGEAIPVVFKFTKCGLGATGKTPTVKLTNDLTLTESALKNSDVTKGILGTDHEKVVVQFGNDSKDDNLPTSKVVVNGGNGDDFFVQFGYAYLKAIANDPDPKDVNAKALFTVTYN